jgi:hypothetical protein
MNKGQRVQVSVDLGVLMPDMASMTEDFPVDCSPVILVSRDTLTSQNVQPTQDDTFRQGYLHPLQTKALQAVDRRDRVLDMKPERINLA